MTIVITNHHATWHLAKSIYVNAWHGTFPSQPISMIGNDYSHYQSHATWQLAKSIQCMSMLGTASSQVNSSQRLVMTIVITNPMPHGSLPSPYSACQCLARHLPKSTHLNDW